MNENIYIRGSTNISTPSSIIVQYVLYICTIYIYIYVRVLMTYSGLVPLFSFAPKGALPRRFCHRVYGNIPLGQKRHWRALKIKMRGYREIPTHPEKKRRPQKSPCGDKKKRAVLRPLSFREAPPLFPPIGCRHCSSCEATCAVPLGLSNRPP